jgi:type IV pilus assembly protein PilW
LEITVRRGLYGEREMLRNYYRGKSFIPIRSEKGFTLVELLVAMAISLLVLASVYSVFQSQQKSTLVREEVNMMQQNLRAGMTVMTRDIRMAGYVHPTVTANAGITIASANVIEFTRLKDDNSLPLQKIKYSLSTNRNLTRNVANEDGSSAIDQLIAENIDALDFVYLDADNMTTTNLGNIRSVQITMIARTGRGDRGYVDTTAYKNQQGTTILPSANDNFRRRKLSREILCRNLF